MAIRDADLDARPSHERALVDRFVRTQDPDAFSALVTSTRPWLVSACTRMLAGDRYMAEDVAQDCYVKAFGFLANGGSPMDFRAWLSAVARNACIDEIRKTRAVPVEDVPERAAAEDDFELDTPLETAWTGLKPRQRQLIFFREFLGMSYREIAAEMACSLPAVETALFRARSSLRRQYRRAGGTAPGLVWLGFGLRGLLRGGRSSTPTRWATSAHDRVTAILARLPSSSPSDLIAGAASLTAVAVLAAGVVAVAHGGGGGPGPPGADGKHAGPAVVAVVSRAGTAHRAHRSSDGPTRTSGSRTSAPQSPAGRDATDALAQRRIQKFGAETLGATGQVVQDATNTVSSTTDTVSQTVNTAPKTVENTISKTVETATSTAQQTESSLPGIPGS